MTTVTTPTPSEQRPPSEPSPGLSWPAWLWSRAQLAVAILLTLGVLLWLLWGGAFHGPPPPDRPPRTAPNDQAVKLAGPGRIALTAGTPLEKKLRAESRLAEEETLTAPSLRVTGSVVASL